MAKTSSLAKTLGKSYPDIAFQLSDDFRWVPEEKTVYFEDIEDGEGNLLHETAHALLGHTDYQQDIDLLRIERDAWSYAEQELAPKFNITISEDAIESILDTYRDWLHARSLCPHCHQTGIQTKDSYRCLGCDKEWRVNEARRCALRRYKLSTTKTPAL